MALAKTALLLRGATAADIVVSPRNRIPNPRITWPALLHTFLRASRIIPNPMPIAGYA
jgi:hypothetical protein